MLNQIFITEGWLATVVVIFWVFTAYKNKFKYHVIFAIAVLISITSHLLLGIPSAEDMVKYISDIIYDCLSPFGIIFLYISVKKIDRGYH